MSLVQVKLFPVVPTEGQKALVINCELGFDSNAAVNLAHARMYTDPDCVDLVGIDRL